MHYEGMILSTASGRLYQVVVIRWWQVWKWWRWWRSSNKGVVTISNSQGSEKVRVMDLPARLPNVPSEKATHLYE